MIQPLIDKLAFWLPRCIACQHRKQGFLDGKCFECIHAEIDRRNIEHYKAALEEMYKSPEWAALWRDLDLKAKDWK